jgi:Rrf2 family protein
MVSDLTAKIGEPKHGFLQFSQKLDYGLFLLIELARKKGADPLSLRKVAEEHGMSFFFMQKVAFELRKAGLVRADRGKNGGYVLAKPAAEISLKQIVETLEGPVTVMQCLVPAAASASCARRTRCRMRHGLGTVNLAIVNIFTKTTLDHLLNSA